MLFFILLNNKEFKIQEDSVLIETVMKLYTVLALGTNSG